MAQDIKAVTILGQGIKHVVPLLKDTFGLDDSEIENLSKVIEIREVDTDDGNGLGPKGYKFDEEEGRSVLLVEKQRGIANKIRVELENKSKGIDYIEDSLQYTIDHSFSDEEYLTSQTLDKVGDILERALGRKTSTTAWILSFILKRMGLIDDSENISGLTMTLKDPKFIKQFNKYYYQSLGDSHNAAEKLEESLGDDPEKDKKIKLASVASTLLKWCNRIPEPLVTIIPVLFAIQNLSMPILANLVPEGKLGRFFDFMRMINPWVSDFVAEPLGLFKAEILDSQKTLKQLDSIDEKNSSTQIVTDSIGVTQLDDEEFRLQRMVGKIGDAFERLFGKGTTLSSWILMGLLKLRSPSQNIGSLYKRFAKDYVENPDFIRELCNHYREINTESKKKGESLSPIEENKLLANRFKDRESWFIARIVSFFTSIAKNIPKELMEGITEKFGMFYCAQYLFMPIITRIIGKDTMLGRILGFVRDVNPYINDLIFDPIATFQTEIRSIKKESANVPNLIPEAKISTPKAVKKVIDYAQNLFTTIRNFGAKTIRGTIA